MNELVFNLIMPMKVPKDQNAEDCTCNVENISELGITLGIFCTTAKYSVEYHYTVDPPYFIL